MYALRAGFKEDFTEENCLHNIRTDMHVSYDNEDIIDLKNKNDVNYTLEKFIFTFAIVKNATHFSVIPYTSTYCNECRGFSLTICIEDRGNEHEKIDIVSVNMVIVVLKIEVNMPVSQKLVPPNIFCNAILNDIAKKFIECAKYAQNKGYTKHCAQVLDQVSKEINIYVEKSKRRLPNEFSIVCDAHSCDDE